MSPASVYDVIVVGLGGMGTATLWQLARRGLRVLGIEQFKIGHRMGSSHGMTRILRLAYFEGSAYVPMVQRAVELWREAEKASGQSLFFEVGSLDMAPDRDTIVGAARQSCLDFDLPFEELDASALMKRFPALRLPQDMRGLYQPEGGFVACERAVTAHAALARAAGAEIHETEILLGWEPTANGGVVVRTSLRHYEAGQLILSPGPWIGDVVPRLKPVTTVIKQSLGWFAPRSPDLLAMDAFPVFTLKVEEGHVYGFPLWKHPGFKLGTPHYSADVFDPNEPDREPAPHHAGALKQIIDRYIPASTTQALDLKACLYTMAPDEHFIIDRLPGTEQILVASPCSGHGFKFASAVGEILADLATTGRPRFDLSLFSIDRSALAA